MRSPSYRAALNHLLAPLGFTQSGDDWTRRVADVEECVSLERSGQGRGVTIDIKSVDLISREMLRNAVPQNSPALKYWVDLRLSNLISGEDIWWKGDPDGPDEVAELTKTHGLPFLERMRSLEAQADYFGRRAVRSGVPRIQSRLWLAITLHRMDEKEEACRALSIPRRRTEIASWAAQVRPLRARLGCPDEDGLAGS